MPNTSASNSAAAMAMALIEGHHRFLLANTGTTNDGQNDHFVLNPQGVLSNNRHFINKTSMEYQPNGDGTTEGQSLLILGYAYAFIATKNKKYLDAAKLYWDAYVTYFYAGQAIPETPQRWIANWIVNAKEPILANYPLNTTEPTEGGFKGVLVNFTNGLGQISANAPNWGQYLDKATFAFVGQLGWNSIVASVYADDGSGNPDYDTPGTKYDVDWIIAWSGQKVDSNGDVLESGLGSGEHGKVKLKNTSINGNYKLNYTTRQPVVNGGYTIGRNEVQHNRPMHVPVNPTTVAFNSFRMSNAADGEEWFADACYLMWKITGDVKYKKALDCVLFTLREFAAIEGTPTDPSYGKFFEVNTTDSDPFNLGTSYYFDYPSETVTTFSRDGSGFILFNTDVAAEVTMEIQTDGIEIDASTSFSVHYGATGDSGGVVNPLLRITYNTTNTSSGEVVYEFHAEPKPLVSPATVAIAASDFKKLLAPSGDPYILASISRTDDYGGAVVSTEWSNNIVGHKGMAVKVVFPDNDAGFDIAFRDQTGEVAVFTTITFKSDAEFDARIEDADGWRWYWILPNTAGVWTTHTFASGSPYLSGYQPNRDGRADPASPNFTTIGFITIVLENADTNKYITYYCVNTLPPSFSATSGFIRDFRIGFDCKQPMHALIGDCKAVDPVTAGGGPLAFTPGVIPFSNVYDVTTGVLDSTNGMPYPGYQYPAIWCLDVSDATRLENMVDFLHASQVAYDGFIGELGPVASAYYWNIPSNTSYGPADTFTMYHWGTDVAWSGYQPRAFQAGARALQELQYRDIAPPAKLLQYLNNWVNWLDTYYTAHGEFPTDFPADEVAAPLSNDFTGHMTGLWLAGLCLCEMGGLVNTKLHKLQDAAVKELRINYKIISTPGHKMNGAWSSDIHLGDDNSKFFGFWAGEILRGLSLYTMLKNPHPGKDMYYTYPSFHTP